MVKARVPTEVEAGSTMISDSGPFGKPLFAKLVPFAVTVAASIYGERRDRLVNDTIIDELETLTVKLQEYTKAGSILQNFANKIDQIATIPKPPRLSPGA